MTRYVDLNTWQRIAEEIENKVERLPFYVDHCDAFAALSVIEKMGFSCLQSVKQEAKQIVIKKQVDNQVEVFTQSIIALPVRGDLVQNIEITLESAELVEPVIELRSRTGHLIESTAGTRAKFAKSLLPSRFARFDELKIRVLSKGEPIPVTISVDMIVYYLCDNGGLYTMPIIVSPNTMVDGGIFGGLVRIKEDPANVVPEKQAFAAIITNRFPPKYSS